VQISALELFPLSALVRIVNLFKVLTEESAKSGGLLTGKLNDTKLFDIKQVLDGDVI